MIKSYVDCTENYDFAVETVDALEREFEYFMTRKSVLVKDKYRMLRYIDLSTGPRPESYREDVEIGSTFATESEREEFYANMKAGGESGMDFSSRWFITANGDNNGTLKDIKTRWIIAVDLNAIMHSNAKMIAKIYGYANNLTKQAQYEAIAEEILIAVNEILWDDETGTWLDYDLINNKLRPYFSPTNLAPLWTNCFNSSRREYIAERTLAYIAKLGLDKFPGGVPNSLFNTGEQWDMPNVWAPMQHFLIVGLENLNNTNASALALKWAERWIQSNYVVFQKTGAMYEKYIATEFGVAGGGGEYEVQKGKK
jgi:alpha,alpha-trehalase